MPIFRSHPLSGPRGAVRARSLVILAMLLAVGLFFVSRSTCLSVGLRSGVWLDHCPDGELRQTLAVSAPGLTRNATTQVTMRLTAHYVTAPNDLRHAEVVSRFTPTLSVLTPKGEVALHPKTEWVLKNGEAYADLALPALNDGTYRLKARAVSSLGEATVELDLPLYVPASVHVLTDRPLYEAGNTVKFRALALKANDLTPLEERPGVWRVFDPSGELLLEERASTGPWGVLAGSFPLDSTAASGTWRVEWRSGDDSGQRTFDVRPFTLPRFRVEAEPLKPFYRRQERPVVKGNVTYSSGAPVANATIELNWSVSGAWPPPTSWVSGEALPKHATTKPDGTFTVELPTIPEDLVGSAFLSASLSAVDPTGDRVEGSVAIRLSKDAIAVDTVSELPGGLVEGFNNRLFVRATTPAGEVLREVSLLVRRAWEPTDRGTSVEVDADGVAVVQLDPGPPVNVVIPALPFRPPPAQPKVTRTSLNERLQLSGEDGDVSLADRMRFDGLEKRLESCAAFVTPANQSLDVAMLVSAAGAVVHRQLEASPLGRCVGKVLDGLSFPPAHERFFTAQWSFDDSELPKLSLSAQGYPQLDDVVNGALEEEVTAARDCLPSTVSSGDVPRLMRWKFTAAKRALELSWAPAPGAKLADSVVACLTTRIGSKTFEPAVELGPTDSIGVARLTIEVPERYKAIKPQDTIITGYELEVTAKRKGVTLGSTTVHLTPGAIPPLRLRASSQVVNPTDTVTVELLRGPDYTGQLPKKLFMSHAYETLEADFDETSRSARFTVPASWEGWAMVSHGGAQVPLYIKPKASLQVSVSPEKPRYAPGQVAVLDIETTVGAAPGPAAVGLVGVDDSLGQLVPLPGPDELAGLRRHATGSPVFGSLDAQALAMGRVRGANAIAATLTRVSTMPAAPAIEAAVSVQAESSFDPNAAQVDRFYVVLGALHEEVRSWEASAAPEARLTPKVLAGLWNQALERVEARKEEARDGWGRRLRLHRLPADLLALTEPRQVVVNGTRLPEDSENWAQWVAKEKP